MLPMPPLISRGREESVEGRLEEMPDLTAATWGSCLQMGNQPPPFPKCWLECLLWGRGSHCGGDAFSIQHHLQATAPSKHLNCKPYWGASGCNGAVHPPQCWPLPCLLLQQHLARFQHEFSYDVQWHKTIRHEEQQFHHNSYHNHSPVFSGLRGGAFGKYPGNVWHCEVRQGCGREAPASFSALGISPLMKRISSVGKEAVLCSYGKINRTEV